MYGLRKARSLANHKTKRIVCVNPPPTNCGHNEKHKNEHKIITFFGVIKWLTSNR